MFWRNTAQSLNARARKLTRWFLGICTTFRKPENLPFFRSLRAIDEPNFFSKWQPSHSSEYSIFIFLHKLRRKHEKTDFFSIFLNTRSRLVQFFVVGKNESEAVRQRRKANIWSVWAGITSMFECRRWFPMKKAIKHFFPSDFKFFLATNDAYHREQLIGKDPTDVFVCFDVYVFIIDNTFVKVTRATLNQIARVDR